MVMAKRRRVAKLVNENMNPMSFGWEDVFYITNLDDGTREYRKETNDVWYNLCLKPNPIYPDCRHYCIACGSNYEAKLRTIQKYVSHYREPENMYEAMRNLTSQGKCGRVMLEKYYDPWWQEYGNTDYVMCYNDDINEAIEIGKQTTVHGDSFTNVKVTFNENEESFFIEGRQGEWFENFVDKIMNFKGYTKDAFYELISDDTDIGGCNQIFAELKRRGCKGIKQLKQIGLFQWLDILAPIVNGWYFYSESDFSYDGEEDY